MFTITLLCVWLSLGDSMAEPIEPLSFNEAVFQGGNVTLSCSYKKFSGTYQTLHPYYCALVPTVTGNPATLYKNLLLHR
ncbi:hypothetical protein P4O66_017035 [Electrophorus voltai]|uniref:Immunoglobulin V-set domain-containing protein n=1 Tax=Electrophorus voltai TaxID=2609070 RepID=A0AAD8YTV1_9TELE|nr:hypothetical protein P4O66_017035 [Electrophorus voltai]